MVSQNILAKLLPRMFNFEGLPTVLLQLACLLMTVGIFVLQLERKLSDLFKSELKLLDLETRTNAKLSGMKTKSDKKLSDLESSMNAKLASVELKSKIRVADLETAMNKELSGLKAKLGKDFFDLGIKMKEKFSLTLSDLENELDDRSDERQEHRIEMIPPLPEN